MRRAVVTLALLPALACGEAVAKPQPSPLEKMQATAPKAARGTSQRPIAELPAEIVSRPGGSGVGALERPAGLRRFFEALARLESGQAREDVRITQFGDSHTAADVQTAVVRRALQSRFGDGGRGFVAIGRPWSRYVQDGLRVGMSTEWAPERGKTSGDGMYGLSGIGLSTRQRGARAWADVTAKSSRAELAYLEQPIGGAFDVFVDGVRVVRVSTRGELRSSAFRTFDVADASAHQVEVRAVGDGDVRVFGMSLDRAQHGVVLDALGILGARISTTLSWDERHWAEQLAHRAPALVVLAYGTNESTDLDMPQHVYERQLVDALGRIARAVPSASCLLLGPPDRAIEAKDASAEGGRLGLAPSGRLGPASSGRLGPASSGRWVTAPKIAEIVAAQRRVAEAAGCAFYDQQRAMGGEGSIAAWAEEMPARAQKDRCHLTREGYAELGGAFSSDLMRAYAAWRRAAF